MEKGSVLMFVAAIVLAFSILGILSSPSVTIFATESSTSSSVTIEKYLAIQLSTNLSNGITYGLVNALPAVDVNATDNFNAASSGTSMFINVSGDSNTAVDFCIKANGGLYDSVGGNTIGLGNETYLNATFTSSTVPGPSSSSEKLTTSYIKAGPNTVPGNVTFYRFWLDVPTSTASGTYNNSITFKGTEIAQLC